MTFAAYGIACKSQESLDQEGRESEEDEMIEETVATRKVKKNNEEKLAGYGTMSSRLMSLKLTERLKTQDQKAIIAVGTCNQVVGLTDPETLPYHYWESKMLILEDSI